MQYSHHIGNHCDNPADDTGIYLAHGGHTLTFLSPRPPQRVYTSLQGIGGAHCGTPDEGDWSQTEITETGYIVRVHIKGNAAALFCWAWYDE